VHLCSSGNTLADPIDRRFAKIKKKEHRPLARPQIGSVVRRELAAQRRSPRSDAPASSAVRSRGLPQAPGPAQILLAQFDSVKKKEKKKLDRCLAFGAGPQTCSVLWHELAAQRRSPRSDAPASSVVHSRGLPQAPGPAQVCWPKLIR
jgi:hypothetical protein